MVRSSAEVGKNCSGRGTKEEKYIQVTPVLYTSLSEKCNTWTVVRMHKFCIVSSVRAQGGWFGRSALHISLWGRLYSGYQTV